MKNHYTYLLSSRTENKYYIGARSCNCPISQDPYMSSSSAMTTKDKQNCNKIILARFSTREEAIQHEIKLHNQFNVAVNPLFWNKAKQTSVGFDTSGVQMSKLRDYQVSEETKEKLRKHNLGKKQSKETITKRVEKLKGKTHTNETKKRIGEKNRIRLLGTKKTKEYIFNSDVKYKDKRIFFNQELGITETLTTWELINKYPELNKAHIYSIVRGNRKSHKNWTYQGEQ